MKTLKPIIDGISKEKNIARELVVEALKKAYLHLARKKLGYESNLEADYDEKDGISLIQYKKVVESVKQDSLEISLDEAKTHDEEVEVGDEIGFIIYDGDEKNKKNKFSISRNDIAVLRQIIFQKISQAEKEKLLEEFNNKAGDVVSGIIKRKENNQYVVSLGKIDAYLPERQCHYNDDFQAQEKVRAYVTQVKATRQGPQILLSRRNPYYLLKVLEEEISEIADGVIEVKAIARDAGNMAKVVVYSDEVEPVKVCIGHNSYHLNSLADELDGEKINFIKYSPNEEEMFVNAIYPAKPENYQIHEDRIDIVADSSDLGFILGKRKANLKLTADLLNKDINLISSEKLSARIKQAREELVSLGLGDIQVQTLINNNLLEPKDVQNVSEEHLSSLGFSDDDIKDMKTKVAKYKGGEDVVDIYELSVSPRPFNFKPKERKVVSSMDDAERRIREELASFRLKS